MRIEAYRIASASRPTCSSVDHNYPPRHLRAGGLSPSPKRAFLRRYGRLMPGWQPSVATAPAQLISYLWLAPRFHKAGTVGMIRHH